MHKQLTVKGSCEYCRHEYTFKFESMHQLLKAQHDGAYVCPKCHKHTRNWEEA